MLEESGAKHGVIRNQGPCLMGGLLFQLLRHGANLHHFTRRPEGSTALHEAVARGQLKVAELLLQYGANPFLENGR
jgi:hypothetical protein